MVIGTWSESSRTDFSQVMIKETSILLIIWSFIKWSWGIKSLHLRSGIKRSVLSRTENFPSSLITSYYRVNSWVASKEAPITSMMWGWHSRTKVSSTNYFLNPVAILDKPVSKMMGLMPTLLRRADLRLSKTYINWYSSKELNFQIFILIYLPLDFLSFIYTILYPPRLMMGKLVALEEAVIRSRIIILFLAQIFSVLYLIVSGGSLASLG